MEMTDEAVANMVISNQLKDHELEKRLDAFRAVQVRRIVVETKLAELGLAGALDQLPSLHSLDYGRVHGANCEIVVGFVPLVRYCPTILP
jgi:hydroxymethylglutaryl-CoA reductase